MVSSVYCAPEKMWRKLLNIYFITLSGLLVANTMNVFVCLFQSDYAYLHAVNSTDIELYNHCAEI